MTNNTEKTLATLLKRSLGIIAIAALIYSCDDNDISFDCPPLQANFGDACDSSGVIDCNCNCITITMNDTLIDTLNYDCQAWQLNYGDYCWTADSIVGTIDFNCNCISDSIQIKTYDCPELNANFYDNCYDNWGNYGYIDTTCNCLIDSIITTTYDCPNLFLNFGDTCVVTADSTSFVWGVVNTMCNCE